MKFVGFFCKENGHAKNTFKSNDGQREKKTQNEEKT